MRPIKRAVLGAANLLGFEIVRRRRDGGLARVFGALEPIVVSQPVSVVFDVGAFDGGMSAEFRRRFPAAQVHAFEPLDTSYRKLCERFGADRMVRPNRCAVSDAVGTTNFYATASAQSNSLLKPLATGRSVDEHHSLNEELVVETTTIDRYCTDNGIDHIDILKLDIQGAELAALKGAESLLSAGRIDIVISEVEFVELYEGQPLFCDIAGYLSRHGYSLLALPRLVPDEIGQLCWGDAIFCSSSVLADVRARPSRA